MKKRILYLIVLVLLVGFSSSPALAKSSDVGFLVLAPDRGFLGNREVATIVDEFKRSHRAALALVGRDYSGVEGEYSTYLRRAVEELKGGGAAEIVAIPLFPSQADPMLKKVLPHLSRYASAGAIRVAAPMPESHLLSQILLDRVDSVSQDPEQERLLVLGIGAIDEASESILRGELQSLTDYVSRYRSFKETQIGIYYDREAEAKLREKKNKEVDDQVIRAAAKKGKTLVVPFFIGPRFDSHMSLTKWIGDKFKEFDLTYAGEEIVPHPNLLLWLKKTANAYLPPSPKRTGVVIMPHGATQPYNDSVEAAIAPLRSRYRIEMAYGMADSETIQQAVSRLEADGIDRIIFVRMYSLSDQFKETTDYILGLSKELHAHGDHEGPPPVQIRSAALFSTFGGYEEDPGIAEILHERIVEISRDPSHETVILVAHGSEDDQANSRWLASMNRQIETLRKDPHCSKLKAIYPVTIREDWPEKRKEEVAKLKEMIKEGKKSGRVLLISNRLRGAGPYKSLLEGVDIKQEEDYEINGKGFSPHPALTRWLQKGIEEAIAAMNSDRPAIAAVAP